VGSIHRTAVNETKRELLIEGEGPSFVRRPTSPTSCHRKTTHNRAFRTFDVWVYGRMVMAKQRDDINRQVRIDLKSYYR